MTPAFFSFTFFSFPLYFILEGTDRSLHDRGTICVFRVRSLRVQRFATRVKPGLFCPFS